MANSLMIGAAKMGMDFRILAPSELFPQPELVKECKRIAKGTDGKITLSSDINQAVKDADVIYTDVWVSMGEEAKFAERIKLLKKYQVNMAMLEKTKNPHVVFLHCLPLFMI